MLLAKASFPHVALLGRVPGTNSYSDLARHPENERLTDAIAFRPEASLIYINADSVLQFVLEHLRTISPSTIRLVVCDLSASPYIDLAGSHMLYNLHGELAERGIPLRIVGAHGRVRDLLRADGVGEKVGGIERAVTLEGLLGSSRP
jgi:MFS superfamily sulfate permease-like transporter